MRDDGIIERLGLEALTKYADVHPYNVGMANALCLRKQRPESPLWVREREILLFVMDADFGVCTCEARKPLTLAMFCWDHRITSGRPGEWQLGEDRFSCARHSDGTVCTVGGKAATSCWPRPRCPKCEALDTMNVATYAWHDEVTCTAPECDYVKTIPIGD